MKRRTKLAVITNVCLALLVLAVAAVCFLPAGIPAASLADRVYYNGNRESCRISLMFNVYWGGEFLGGIMDVLERYGVRATFFIGGCWADDNAELVKEIADRGHELGNHGYFHKDQSALSYEQNAEEISSCGKLVETLTGQEVTLFAPPSGAYAEQTVRAAEDLGYSVIMWSKDTIDWRDHDASLIYRRATQNAQGGDLVLMHPTEATLEALPSVLEHYARMGLLQSVVSANIAEGRA